MSLSMPKRSNKLRSLLRVSGVLAVAGIVVAIISGVVAYVLYDKYVVKEPGPHLERQYIMSVIAQESPVYYRDGTTRVGGVF